MKKINRKFVSLANVSKYLYCCICEEIFNNPIRTKECGHTFCKTCLQKWVKYNKNCPLCRKNIVFKNTKRDIIAYNIINDLEVFCNNNNCPWKGKLSNLKKHLKNCNMNPSNMNDIIKEALTDGNKRNTICCSKSTTTTTTINIKDESEKIKNSDTEDDEGRASVDSITSFNTRVGLRARLFNRNKTLVNNVLNNDNNKRHSEYSIFSIIDENNIKI